jgi:FkbM family methyltransferase
MRLAHELRKVLWKAGVDISPFNPSMNPLARRKKLMETYGINVVFDVGANTGQFAQQTRNDMGYNGKIFSFEPVLSAYEILKRHAAKDPGWKVFNWALGEAESFREINISGNSQSSSFLNMLPGQIKASPESAYVTKQMIEIRTLDSLFYRLCSKEDDVYLKIDTQGYESKVLKGAENSLGLIGTIQLEMSLEMLYEGEMMFADMHDFLSGKGYSLVSIEPGFSDPHTGRLLEIDGIYHRL